VLHVQRSDDALHAAGAAVLLALLVAVDLREPRQVREPLGLRAAVQAHRNVVVDALRDRHLDRLDFPPTNSLFVEKPGGGALGAGGGGGGARAGCRRFSVVETALVRASRNPMRRLSAPVLASFRVGEELQSRRADLDHLVGELARAHRADGRRLVGPGADDAGQRRRLSLTSRNTSFEPWREIFASSERFDS